MSDDTTNLQSEPIAAEMIREAGTAVQTEQSRLVDNFSSYVDYGASGGPEDDDAARTGGPARGERIKFKNSVWNYSSDDRLCTGAQRLALNVHKLEVKWGPGAAAPLEQCPVKPNERGRDLAALNEACPRSEWRERFGKIVGPWEYQEIVEFVDPETLEQSWWAASTQGGRVAVAELVSRIKVYREFKGGQVFPLVALRAKPFSVKYGQQRPFLAILRWAALTGDGVAWVAPLSPGEELNDSIAY